MRERFDSGRTGIGQSAAAVRGSAAHTLDSDNPPPVRRPTALASASSSSPRRGHARATPRDVSGEPPARRGGDAMGRAYATPRGRRRDARDTLRVGDGGGSGPRRARARRGGGRRLRASVEGTPRPGRPGAARAAAAGGSRRGDGRRGRVDGNTPEHQRGGGTPPPAVGGARRRRAGTLRGRLHLPGGVRPVQNLVLLRRGLSRPGGLLRGLRAPGGVRRAEGDVPAATPRPRGGPERPPASPQPPRRRPHVAPLPRARPPPRRDAAVPADSPAQPRAFTTPSVPTLPSPTTSTPPRTSIPAPAPVSAPAPPRRAPNPAAALAAPRVEPGPAGPGPDGDRAGRLRGPSRDLALRRPPSAPGVSHPPARAVPAASRDPAVPVGAVRQTAGGASVFSVLRHPRAPAQFAQGRPAVGGARGGGGEATVGADTRPRADPNRRLRGDGPEVDVQGTVRGFTRGGTRVVGVARGTDGTRRVANGSVGRGNRRRGWRRRGGASSAAETVANDGEAVSAMGEREPGY